MMFEQVLAKFEQTPIATQTQEISSIAVIGADPVGQSIACAALATGHRVTLHSSFGGEIRKLVDAEELSVKGSRLAGTYRVAAGGADARTPVIRVVPELDMAIKDADVVVLAVPAFTHATYAALLAPILHRGQMVVLAPSRTLGAVEVGRVLRQHARTDITIVEISSAPYDVSQPRPGELIVEAERRAVLAAALHSPSTPAAVSVLEGVFPMLRAASGVLETSFSNMDGTLIAAPALLSSAASGRATLRERLPADLVDTLLPQLDRERRRTAFAYGARNVMSLHEWLEATYGTVEKDLVNALDEIEAYGRIPCPTLADPCVRDAVAAGLVPIASAGEAAGVPTPATSALIALASALHGLDYVRHGRTMAALGLDRLRPDEIRRALDGADRALAQEVFA
jgi:opine dehydrogenase